MSAGATRPRALAAALVIAGAVACQPPPGAAPPAAVAPVDPLAPAAAMLDREDFEGASRVLWQHAATCDPELGETRHRATLLLATSELDVANPSGSPGQAAVLALRLIDDPRVSDERAAMARTIFRLALDRGAADPSTSDGQIVRAWDGRERIAPESDGQEPYAEREPDTGIAAESAHRPELPLRCASTWQPGAEAENGSAEVESGGAEAENGSAATLDGNGETLNGDTETQRESAWTRGAGRMAPTPPPGPTTFERLNALQDSLDASADEARRLRASMTDLRARVQDLEAELERITKLLKGPPRR